MNIFRRVIALVVLATIVFGMLSVTAAADPGTVTADTGELSVEGVSDLGELLAENVQSG